MTGRDTRRQPGSSATLQQRRQRMGPCDGELWWQSGCIRLAAVGPRRTSGGRSTLRRRIHEQHVSAIEVGLCPAAAVG